MSMFSDIVKSAPWEDLVRVHGTSVTYYPAGDTDNGSEIDVVYTPNNVLMDYQSDGETDVRRSTLKASPDDITSPDIDDTFLIDSEIWAVEAIGKRAPIIEMQLYQAEKRFIGGDGTIKTSERGR